MSRDHPTVSINLNAKEKDQLMSLFPGRDTRLRTYNQKMTVATRRIAEWKMCKQRS